MLDAHNVLQSAWQSAFGTPSATATVKLQNVTSFRMRPEFQTRALEQLRGTLLQRTKQRWIITLVRLHLRLAMKRLRT